MPTELRKGQRCKAKTYGGYACLHTGPWVGYCTTHYKMIYLEGKKIGPRRNKPYSRTNNCR